MTNEELIVSLSRKVAELERDNLNYKKWWSEARNELDAARIWIAEQTVMITDLHEINQKQTEKPINN
jgi:hypothetical protein